jgi:hypothetical protein
MRIEYTASNDIQIAQFTFLEAHQNAIPSGRLTWVTLSPTIWLSVNFDFFIKSPVVNTGIKHRKFHFQID